MERTEWDVVDKNERGNEMKSEKLYLGKNEGSLIGSQAAYIACSRCAAGHLRGREKFIDYSENDFLYAKQSSAWNHSSFAVTAAEYLLLLLLLLNCRVEKGAEWFWK